MKTPHPPLSKVELQAIQDRRRDDPDVMALLWEISRLRLTLLHADQLECSIGPTGGMVEMIRQGLRQRLNQEPCVMEFPRLKRGK